MLNILEVASKFGGKPSESQKNKRKLMSQFFKDPQSVGTIHPSSRELAEAMIEPVDFTVPGTILEYGPGTGAITSVIAERLTEQTRYIGIEINKEFCKDLSLKFPNLTFVNKSATEAASVLELFAIDKVDAIFCGIPWASLPASLQREILDGAARYLRPGGMFITYAYLQGLILPGAWALRRNLKARFPTVRTSRIIWNNVPPAFAYICRR
jgi:phosphatidylethanolamine/phosphatidyl-N-methylethanolamine N-methyltransferase